MHIYVLLYVGLIGSFIRILLIPFVSYGYAVLLLDFNEEIHFFFESFDWNHYERSTFLIHVGVSYLTYLFAWIACAIQPLAFFVPMLLSTPISFVWYLYNVEANEIFPFTGEYFVGWNLHYPLLLIACLLWLSQFFAFSYHIFQRPDKVLTRDSDLFWMPRYNSIFLEQQLILNRKNPLSGPDKTNKSKIFYDKIVSEDNFIFICSTMYHETEMEMKQLLNSIKLIAEIGSDNDRELKFESHIFFDNGCNDTQISQWALQLLGLLKDTLDIDITDAPKIITPYGIQLRYIIENWMPFYIHLKDNSKVKSKKRWSQVMYMKYILKHHYYNIVSRNHNKASENMNDLFILTTDADIEFDSGSVVALLDILARDDKVGAVCARTHPLGKGPVVWYQKFDYAVGHWLQKAAEHILGCVLCCPGCFSVFRAKALNNALEEYSSNAEDGFDFLIKDMGEDRWLCSLLIKKGWRLEYSAVSQDSTYCPESFEEFYKQRRRWIPSTIANLTLLINSWKKITSNNNSITILFILYELIIVISSLISPATVILIITSGIRGIDNSVNEAALIIVLSIISVLYGVICIYATEKTQLSTSKFLTLIFSIVMAVVISGTISDTIDGVIGDSKINGANGTSQNFQFPVDINVFYSGVFAAVFIAAGLLHFNEIFCLFHFIWYLLCLPSGYMFLIIYSICNLNNRSWGTREGTKPKASHDSESWLDYFLEKWSSVYLFLRKWFKKMQNSQASPSTTDSEIEQTDSSSQSHQCLAIESHQCLAIEYTNAGDPMLDEAVIEWLKEHKCYVSKRESDLAWI